MLPILFTVGPFAVSSFGLFLTLGVFTAVFLSWRLARLYDLSEEKIIDLATLTFFGGLLGARVFFVLFHSQFFNGLDKVIQLNRYPGLSFWGGLVGGMLAFWFFAGRLKFNFWQIADFAAVSLLVGIVFGDFGCFFSGCSYGIASSLPIAAPVVGAIGKRLPITAIEGLVLLPLCFYLWKQAIRFHFSGKITALFFMALGVVKLGTEYYHAQLQPIFWVAGREVAYGHLFSSLLVLSGIVIFYRQSKRSFWSDIQTVYISFAVSKKRQATLFKLRRSWYNQTVVWKIRADRMAKSVRCLPQNLQRRLNVKPNPANIKQSQNSPASPTEAGRGTD